MAVVATAVDDDDDPSEDHWLIKRTRKWDSIEPKTVSEGNSVERQILERDARDKCPSHSPSHCPIPIPMPWQRRTIICLTGTTNDKDTGEDVVEHSEHDWAMIDVL